ncbi:hypothetical protein HBH56_020220 [Parastagonospora nodorum]|uniref:Uncharacterized protein n=1 Tax=Phaeosphaeria nodorum (strain SN15 / ATCC MYA-4574 / FGSC 10173) TaxID=321614 RepID=A0A7U2HYK5_PHANO|nr:hypothetical protein HBH56_020220 [Parastagonospora nodorum]QRC95413.1 hypothetical protein JI435_407320 [Parastagonospora nodorum SN15]KAH3937469.1 hypothetical protein HBH54_014290 [Parastagonospora nodorum]KAH4006560.1 hypothetical protein HBI10_014160 [Parastagonospora nodorum]KAH4025646.1 hypothetical protein HBI13_068080 [Parastagonospora nodorum]
MRHLKAMIPPTFAMSSPQLYAFPDGENAILYFDDTVPFLSVAEYGVNFVGSYLLPYCSGIPLVWI